MLIKFVLIILFKVIFIHCAYIFRNLSRNPKRIKVLLIYNDLLIVFNVYQVTCRYVLAVMFFLKFSDELSDNDFVGSIYLETKLFFGNALQRIVYIFTFVHA